jgi:hypothetical protein
LLRPGQAKAKVIDKRWPRLFPLNSKECRSPIGFIGQVAAK